MISPYLSLTEKPKVNYCQSVKKGIDELALMVFEVLPYNEARNFICEVMFAKTYGQAIAIAQKFVEIK